LGGCGGHEISFSTDCRRHTRGRPPWRTASLGVAVHTWQGPVKSREMLDPSPSAPWRPTEPSSTAIPWRSRCVIACFIGTCQAETDVAVAGRTESRDRLRFHVCGSCRALPPAASCGRPLRNRDAVSVDAGSRVAAVSNLRAQLCAPGRCVGSPRPRAQFPLDHSGSPAGGCCGAGAGAGCGGSGGAGAGGGGAGCAGACGSGAGGGVGGSAGAGLAFGPVGGCCSGGAGASLRGT
jgi:hypothetical protein